MKFIRTADNWSPRPAIESEAEAYASAVKLAQKLRRKGATGYVRVYAEIGRVSINPEEPK